ncbi:MAG: hypothetical protein ACRDO1_18470, partial [Nocardioidaceae bacterium]
LSTRTTEVPFRMVVSPHDSDSVAITFWSLRGRGVFVTRDGGDTWKKLMHDRQFTAVAADPAVPERLWLGSADGLYRSDDFGASVVKVADGSVASIAAQGTRIVTGGSRIGVSDDGGSTWRTADTGGLPLQVSDLAVSPTRADTIFAATRSHAANGLVKGGRGVLRSTDGGRTWDNVSGGLQNLAVTSLAIDAAGRWLFAGTIGGGVHRLRVH